MLILERGLTSPKLALELYETKKLSVNDQIKVSKMLCSGMIHYENSSEDYDARCEQMWQDRLRDERKDYL